MRRDTVEINEPIFGATGWPKEIEPTIILGST